MVQKPADEVELRIFHRIETEFPGMSFQGFPSDFLVRIMVTSYTEFPLSFPACCRRLLVYLPTFTPKLKAFGTISAASRRI